jgi:hypothetical protein
MSYHSGDQIIKNLSFESGAEMNLTNCAQRLRCQTKAAAYTLKASDSGTYFDTTGDGAGFTFTLPAYAPKGTYFVIVNSTSQTVLVAAATADTLITYGDTAADSVSITDIGVYLFIYFNGTAWYAISPANDGGASLTVNT